jgi:hypothetical protein
LPLFSLSHKLILLPLFPILPLRVLNFCLGQRGGARERPGGQEVMWLLGGQFSHVEPGGLANLTCVLRSQGQAPRLLWSKDGAVISYYSVFVSLRICIACAGPGRSEPGGRGGQRADLVQPPAAGGGAGGPGDLHLPQGGIRPLRRHQPHHLTRSQFMSSHSLCCKSASLQAASPTRAAAQRGDPGSRASSCPCVSPLLAEYTESFEHFFRVPECKMSARLDRFISFTTQREF